MAVDKKQDNNFDIEFGIDQNIRNRIIQSIDNNLTSPLKKLFSELHPADQADIISSLNNEQISKLIAIVAPILDPEILTYLNDDLKNQIIELLGVKDSAKAINQLETEDAVQVIETLDNAEISEILDQVSNEKRTEIEEALSYPENSVGRLMKQNFIAFKKDWSVAKATYHLQNTSDLPDDFYKIVIVDDDFRPISEVKVSQILKSKKQIVMSEIMASEDEIRVLYVNMDKEEASKIFAKYSLNYAPVVDEKGVLSGVIYADDIIDIIKEEAEEDILLLGGVQDGNLSSSPLNIAKSRIPWLLTSLFTSSLAVIIIALFSDQIQKIVALAVIMPVVASIAGNAGTQALTVLVRAIATSDIDNFGKMRILLKEIKSSLINGIILAIIASIICYLWQSNILLGLVLAMAIITTVLIGGVFGALIPMILHRLKFDPAVASGVFLITITDAFSFLVFLGLATIFLN
jgi:magnesium transporter